MTGYRVLKSDPPHPADGLTAIVEIGDDAAMEIINPQSFGDGGPEWQMRYGNPEPIRYTVAGLLSSYDALLSDDIPMSEATRTLYRNDLATAEHRNVVKAKDARKAELTEQKEAA